MASLEDFPLERRISKICDFDLTLSENYQQEPLFAEYLENIKREHSGRIIPRKDKEGRLLVVDGNYVPECDKDGNIRRIEIKEPLDYFRVVESWTPPHNGVGWLELMKRDIRKGVFPIKREDLRRLGSKIELSPGLPDFFDALRKEWQGKCYIHTAIISVGFRDMIIGNPIAQHVDEVYASELFSLDGPEDLSETYVNITPFNKTEAVITLAKGGKENKDKKMKDAQLRYLYPNFICTGDGISDVSHFAYIEQKGGTIFGVYKRDDLAAFKKADANHVFKKRIHYLLPRDYTMGSPYWEEVNTRIEKILSNTCKVPKRIVDMWKNKKLNDPIAEAHYGKHIADCEECQFLTGPVKRVAPRK